MKNGDLQRILRAGIGDIALRPEIIRDTLNRLISKGLVQSAEYMRKPVYYLTNAGEKRTLEGTSEAQSLFDPVLSEILAQTDESLDKSQAAGVLQEFICAAFARFGASIADDLAGRRPHFANSIELSITFDEIAAKRFVPSGCRESLKARCLGVFRRKSLATHRLILRLTQGYCFAQLLGVDRAKFNPITEEAFRGSVFYLDTNVLIAGLLPGDRGAAFAEILGIAKRVGAELRVTRATIDEARHTAADKLVTLQKILGAVPDEVAELSNDEFVSHFYDLRRDNPTLKPADFLADFESIADVVRGRWGVMLEELSEDMLLNGVDVSGIGAVVQAATVELRGWGKNEHVLRHDIAHLNLVREARKAAPKTWFLTRDGALISASEKLAIEGGPAEKPFCFGMLGFLQSISPFVSSSTEDNVLANFFSALLTEQIFISDKLFDDRELALISETHADVMAMPSDQVIVAVDYVKRHVLKGERYNTENIPRVALELRKYLSANTEERQRALQAIADQNNEKYQATRREMMRERALREEYERRLEELEEELEKSRLVSSAQQEEIYEIKRTQQEQSDENRRKEEARHARNRRIVLSVISVLGGFSVGHYNPELASWITGKWDFGPKKLAEVALILGFIKVGLLLLPLLFFIPLDKRKPEIRTAMIALVVILWLWMAGVQSSQTIGELSNAATVALYFTLFLTKSRDSKQ
jgi:hypothetical protein